MNWYKFVQKQHGRTPHRRIMLKQDLIAHLHSRRAEDAILGIHRADAHEGIQIQRAIA